MIKTQMGSTVDKKWSLLHGAICTILPRNSNPYPVTKYEDNLTPQTVIPVEFVSFATVYVFK
jgi:hypothetical protein